MLNIELPQEPTILLLDTYSRKMTHPRNNLTRMFSAGFLIIAEK